MLISVIVPVYGVEKYLTRCVESIKNQTHHNLEIILVDDGSPDMCPKMCDDFAAGDKRIKVLHKQNGGLGSARNAGLLAATGEYLTFVDSDDWLAPDHIEGLYKAVSENNADIAYGSLLMARDEMHAVKQQMRMRPKLYNGKAEVTEVLLSVLGAEEDFPQDVKLESSVCTNLYRTSIISKNSLTFPSEKIAVGEDMFFNAWCIYFSNRIVITNNAGYYYFSNDSSITRKYNPLRYERTLNFYTNSCSLVEKLGLSDVIAHRIERTFLLKMRTAIRLAATSDMTKREKISEIKRYLNNETVAAVLKNYPIKTLIPAMRPLAYLMRNKNAAGVYYLIKFREAAKGQKHLKQILRFVGIGK